MLLLLLFYLLLVFKLVSMAAELLEANTHNALIPNLFISLLGSDLLFMLALMVCCYLLSPMVNRTHRLILILLSISASWDIVNCALMGLLFYSEKVVLLERLFYIHLGSSAANLLSLACGFARGRGEIKFGGIGKSDLEIGPDKADALEFYYDKNRSDLELHIHDDSVSKPTAPANTTATSIANYSARRSDEVSLRQFERVQLISQHKSYSVVERRDGTRGKVPASLLSISEPQPRQRDSQVE